MNDADREAVIRAAAAYDKVEQITPDLQRRLDETAAHLKAQETLVNELRLSLSEERNNCATYRAEAERARADSTAILGLLSNCKAMFDGFEIPSEKLPMRRQGNGDATSIADQSTGNESILAPLEARVGGIASASE